MKARRVLLGAALLLTALQPGSQAGETALATERRVLRVGTSADYAPFSYQRAGAPDGLDGFDIALARRFAEDRGWKIEWVRFRWPDLLDDLAHERFDVAMSGVTVRPERSVAGRFSAPVTTTGALALVPEESGLETLEDLQTPGLRIGVNAGGHLERVARDSLQPATILAIPDNESVLMAMMERTVDAIVTDDLEAPRWQARAPGLRPVGPFSRDRKAYLVRPDRPELATELDAWLFAREADGTLAELRLQHLGPGASQRTATPFYTLLAAVDERLGLMVLVGEAKRRLRSPVRVPEREALVLEAAVASARSAAKQAGQTPLPDRWVRRLFQAQIDAAVDIQQAQLRRAPSHQTPADLDSDLRPALLRLGKRIVDAAVRLPGPLDPSEVDRLVVEEVTVPGLEVRHTVAIADAIAQISRYRGP